MLRGQRSWGTKEETIKRGKEGDNTLNALADQTLVFWLEHFDVHHEKGRTSPTSQIWKQNK